MLATHALGFLDFESKVSDLGAGLVARVRPWLDRASTRANVRVPLIESALGRVDPTLSLHRVLARVVEVRAETHDVKTFVLRPNARFGAFRAGAYVTLHLSIGGRPVQRSYSLSSAPGEGLVAITVKRVPGGLVSNHLADNVGVSDVLELSAPAGQFLLQEQSAAAAPAKLLMISAGSGITPVMSMLRDLVKRGSHSDVTFLHFARTPGDVIFRAELDRIAARCPNVKVVTCVENLDGDTDFAGLLGRFSEALIAGVEPDYRDAETYLCGPSGFMRAVLETFERAGADLSKLRYESFGASLDASSDAFFDPSAFLEHTRTVRFLRSRVESLSSKPLTVLQEAEARGIRVQTGCRAGTCGTCRCKKRKGVVVNVATGRESGQGEEMIYPCVSVAKGTIEVDL